MTDNEDDAPTSPWTLPAELRTIAEVQLHENEQSKFIALEKLKDLISKISVDDRIDDQSDVNLIRFLRSKKFDVDRALKATIAYRRFYNSHGAALKDLKAEEFVKISPYLTILSDKDPEGRTILAMQPKNGLNIFSPEYLVDNPRALLRANVWIFEVYLLFSDFSSNFDIVST
jgi:hypothetical protein